MSKSGRWPRSSSATDPDVILLNEFDYVVADGSAVDLLKQNYLEVSQNGAARRSRIPVLLHRRIQHRYCHRRMT